MDQKQRPPVIIEMIRRKQSHNRSLAFLLVVLSLSLLSSHAVLAVAALPASSSEAAIAQSGRQEVAEAVSIDLKDVLDTQIESLDLSAMDHFIATLDSETLALFPEFDLRELAAGKGVDWGNLFSQLLRQLFREIVLNANLIGQMVVLAVLCVVLRHIQLSEGSSGELAFTVCFLTLFVLGIHGFGFAQQTAAAAVNQMSDFMYAMLPIMITLLAAVGGIGSAAMIHPVMVALIGATARLISVVVLPLAMLSAVVGAVGHLSDKYPLSKMAGLLRTVTVSILGLGLCIFTGVITVRGLVASVADGLTIRTAKYVSGSFIPVVGKFFSDTVELITGCSLLLKNSLSVFGVAGLIVICAFPAVKILVLSLLYRLVGALLQPLGEPRLADALTAMGNALTLVFAAVAVVGVLFFVGLSIMTGLSNLTVMVR